MWSAAQPLALRVAFGGIAGIYFVAFASLAAQVAPLLGAGGLTPVAAVVASMPAAEGFAEAPSLLWLPGLQGDGAMVALAWAGLGIAGALVGWALFGDHRRVSHLPAIGLGALWAIYLSFVQLGDRWYGYGWETLLLEAGALTAVLAATRSRAVLVLYRWLTFRLMFGAGLIKLRGDSCWRDLTCLRYHFETQPIPNPLSWYLHHLPSGVLDAGVAWNHVVELVVPWGLFLPRTRRVAAWIIVHFQTMLILSGNLSFLNWLTLAICLPIAFDAGAGDGRVGRRARWAAGAYGVLVVALSVQPTLNLLTPGQRMNASFDRLHLVNTYGAFGSVGRERHEVILLGFDGHAWKEWELPFKPGAVDRMPGVIAPFQPRLDWQIWFAAMQSPARNTWLVHLLYQLLQGRESAKSLLANDPFPDAPPLQVRADLYRYQFTEPGEAGWWRRERVGAYLRVFDLADPDLLVVAAEEGW